MLAALLRPALTPPRPPAILLLLLSLSYTACAALRDRLTSHKAADEECIEALLSSQRHLTSSLRTLINGESASQSVCATQAAAAAAGHAAPVAAHTPRCMSCMYYSHAG
jgi:hypothetical protein